ncbi:membrane protein [Clostridium saccharobutylicum]|uniref:TIGR03943 family putative permease subunit n=1 Tax=Clostridium saccharobutylicum TaxID=169679 RepID=UPI00059FC8FB|nr:membrane protein [Clostridium saccharobutylicum]AQR90034.1 hypothetical protein CLOSC_17410 [Clostridium saccharobutylicum]AQR99939.1 hypothetical protein CSACC_17480 [Clostridium saccharobutylicum]AQS09723.1 hypothetical protein CLOBY_18540 [Clostridium saccharobutylicum]AQS13923.1 hypothetical protein CLOSACC_17480 [Clostridium saccharobutylicum]MBA2904670.1 putative repeat protein (TIGR03943 family) [Clostridium saccharobutylicum]
MKRFNFDEFLWFIIITLLDICLIYLVVTGKIEFYIGKKMIIYIYVTIAVISIISIFQISNIFTPKSSGDFKIKMLPIILTLIIGVISVCGQGTFKHIELDKEVKESDSQINLKHNHDDNLKNTNSYISESDLNKNTKDGFLIINEQNPLILKDIVANSQKYIGRNLEIHGFVCKESYLNKNQFVIGRVIMNCCAADSEVVGIIGEYENSIDLRENQLVSVKGKINYSTINDNDGVEHKVPIIKIYKLETED